jgi:hypothetical protein
MNVLIVKQFPDFSKQLRSNSHQEKITSSDPNFSLSPYRGDSVYNYYTASERHPATVLATITA